MHWISPQGTSEYNTNILRIRGLIKIVKAKNITDSIQFHNTLREFNIPVDISLKTTLITKPLESIGRVAPQCPLPVTMVDADRILEFMKVTTCAHDPGPLWLLKSCKEQVNNSWMPIINHWRCLPSVSKRSGYSSAMFKTSLEKNDVVNYCSLSVLPSLGKMTDNPKPSWMTHLLLIPSSLASGLTIGLMALVSLADNLLLNVDKGCSSFCFWVYQQALIQWTCHPIDMPGDTSRYEGTCFNWFN